MKGLLCEREHHCPYGVIVNVFTLPLLIIPFCLLLNFAYIATDYMDGLLLVISSPYFLLQ